MIGLTLVLVAFAASPAPAGAELALGAYLEAAKEGRSGTVAGRAIGDRLSPGAPDSPLGGLPITLVPASPDVLERLREVKERARDDMSAYRQSARAFAQVRRAYERRLAEAGGAGLVRSSWTGPDGRFTLKDVPAGAWLLLAERSVLVETGTPRPATSPRNPVFRPRPRLVGYHAVTVWVREITVEPGQTTTVELTDRNAWMTGIEEERVP